MNWINHSNKRTFMIGALYGAFIVFLLGGCGIYSFRGVNLPPSVKTLSIQPFFNQSTLGPPDMGNTFTERLRQYFERNTALRLVPKEGDLHVTGSVTEYALEAVAPTGVQNQNVNFSGLTRLRLKVAASYYNTKASEFDFENREFTFFLDVDQNKVDIVEEESELITQIMDQIILDIFMASLANW